MEQASNNAQERSAINRDRVLWVVEGAESDLMEQIEKEGL